MPDKTAPRPPQVTIAAGLVMVGSVFVVLSSFDQVAGLHTMETREAVEKIVNDGVGKSLGLDVQGTLSILRVLTMVSAACATAAGILGYQVLRRSRSARLVLTVLAAPLFLTGIAVGGFFPAVVVGAIVMLWFQPARDWIDGKAPRPAPTPPPLPALRPTPTMPAEPPTTAGEPRPVSGFGDRASLLASLPPPRTAPLTSTPAATTRPPALVWACVMAWVGSSLTFLVMLASAVMIVASPDLLMDEVYRQNPSLEQDGITLDDLQSTVLYVAVLLVVWSSVAIVLAAYAWRGRAWAWTALFVSATSAALLCLLGVFGNPVAIIPFGICAAAAVLLRRPEVRAYYR